MKNKTKVKIFTTKTANFTRRETSFVNRLLKPMNPQ